MEKIEEFPFMLSQSKHENDFFSNLLVDESSNHPFQAAATSSSLDSFQILAPSK